MVGSGVRLACTVLNRARSTRVAFIFLNRYYAPDHSATAVLLTDLAAALAQSGADVRIVTSRQRINQADARLPPHETMSGVRVWRVFSTRFGRDGLIGRTVDYLSFHLAAAVVLWRLCRKGDVVIAKTDPPLISVTAAAIAAARGAVLVNWLQDLFPEVAAALGVRLARGPVGAVARALRNQSLRRAAGNVVLGRRMAERLYALGVHRDRVVIIQNWADGRAIRPLSHMHNSLRQRLGMKDRFVVVYAGNMGRAHDFETLMAAARSLAGSPEFLFLLIGDGAARSRMETFVASQKLENVCFLNFQPAAELNEVLNAADLHVVSLRPQMEGLIVPSKVYNIMAAGRPFLNIGAPDGEVAMLAATADCGETVAVGAADALARAITALAGDREHASRLGQNGRDYFQMHFTRERAIEAWRDVLA